MLGLAIFVLYFVVYVLSNASTSFEPSDSPAKHFIIVGAGVLSFFVLPRQSFRSLVMFSPLALIYQVGQLPAYAAMALALAASLPLLSRGVHALIEGQRNDILRLMAVVSLVPFLMALLAMEPDAIFSSYYGRPRLLLGYWHPKEAAASLAVPMFLYFLMRERQVPLAVMVLLPSLLWAVGSRNAALAMYLALGVRLYPKWTFLILGASVAGLGLFVAAASNSFDVFDELLSLRFSVWGDALSDAMEASSTDLIGGDRLAIDSYYIEVFLSSGTAGLALLAAWIVAFYCVCVRPYRRNSWSRALFFSILFFAAFDSGIVSTGNIFHILSWTIIGIPLFKGTPRRRISKRPRLSTPALLPSMAQDSK